MGDSVQLGYDVIYRENGANPIHYVKEWAARRAAGDYSLSDENGVIGRYGDVTVFSMAGWALHKAQEYKRSLCSPEVWRYKQTVNHLKRIAKENLERIHEHHSSDVYKSLTPLPTDEHVHDALFQKAVQKQYGQKLDDVFGITNGPRIINVAL